MKVFVSRQKADSEAAAAMAARLQTAHRIDCYVDVIDPNLSSDGETLGDYLRRDMRKCTQLIAVVSASTKLSQWVPWEIDIATEKVFPLATYLGYSTLPPEFLQKWPYLRSLRDVDEYANVSKAAEYPCAPRKSYLAEDEARRNSTGEFFRTLRTNLRQ